MASALREKQNWLPNLPAYINSPALADMVGALRP